MIRRIPRRSAAERRGIIEQHERDCRAIVEAGWVTVEVDWLASPQGSHFSPAKGVVKENNPRTEPYRQAVADACEAQAADWCFDIPVEVEIVFRLMPPPKGDPGREWPYYPPDLDKLLRATFDGMTRGGIWKDDARCCRLRNVEKIHAGSPEQTGVTIRVRAL